VSCFVAAMREKKMYPTIVAHNVRSFANNNLNDKPPFKFTTVVDIYQTGPFHTKTIWKLF
jgi:hypothetical protein